MSETAKASINNSNVFVFILNIYLNYFINFYKLGIHKHAGVACACSWGGAAPGRVTGLMPRGRGAGERSGRCVTWPVL